jgi:serine/threonine-protein kinase
VPGSRGLSNYQLVAEIGRGGMADVFLAVRRDGGQDDRLVVKQLRADVAEDEDFRAMFMDEARLAVRLVHPNIVRTFEAGRKDGRCFIAMEFLDGQPLSRVRRRGWREGKLPLDAHLRVLADVLAGLDYVHELPDVDGTPLGIVHRDVTPPNVFVCYDGRVKVVDFGIAKAATRLAETRIGVVKGKISYMAPEHARGEQVDRRSDVFSVGVMFWEAVSGRRYWDGHEELTIYRRLLAGDLPSVGREHHVGHRAFANIFEQALAVDPAKRYRTAGEMRLAIEDALRQMGSRADQTSVGRTVGELFERERVAFHTAVRAELLRLKAGKHRTSLAVLNNSGASLTPETEVHGLRASAGEDRPPTRASAGEDRPPTRASAGEAPPPPNRPSGNPSTPAMTTDDVQVEFRPKLGWLRAGMWVGLGILLGLGAWNVVQRATSEDEPRAAAQPAAYAAVANPEKPAAPSRAKPRVEPAAPAPTAEPVAREAEAVAPEIAKPHASAPPARARPAPARASAQAAPDEFKKTPRAKRALDQDDPWSE